MIKKFTNDYVWLSNFYECEVIFGGVKYGSTEAAFQAQKSTDDRVRLEFAGLDPETAKAKGRKVALREDWEQVKNEIMYEVNMAKFEQNPELKEKLLATGHEELIEGNHHGDTYWGKVDGVGENYLGRTLMRVRNEFRGFDAAAAAEHLISWIRRYFEENASPTTKAVVGISGGKDSSVTAKLCALALGTDRVIGVLMPQGEQADIDCSRKLVEAVGIRSFEVNVGAACAALMEQVESQVEMSSQARINTPPRIRMAALYAVAGSVGGRVANTCNLSEDWVGYATKFGDGAGDFSVLARYTVTEILGIGDYLGLPYDLVHKTPIDGLCGKSDEENLGFTYAELDDYIRGFDDLADRPELKARIDRMHAMNTHKLIPMPRA